jgi:two-component system response regulator QseB
MKLLLAEDDPVLGRALEIGLRHEGLTVDWTRNGLEAVSICGRRSYAALILDLGLPDMGGFEILHRIRQFDSDIPILVLTARDSIEDRILGLDFGADEYVTKPFEFVELLARLRVLQRRVVRERVATIIAEDLALDPRSHVVTLNRRPIPLNAREFALLRLLMRTSEVSLSEAARYLDTLGGDIEEDNVAGYLRLLQEKLDMRVQQGDRGWRLLSDRTLH